MNNRLLAAIAGCAVVVAVIVLTENRRPILAPAGSQDIQAVKPIRPRLSPLGDPAYQRATASTESPFACDKYISKGERLHSRIGQQQGPAAQKSFVEQMTRLHKKSESILTAYDQYSDEALQSLRSANPQFAREYDDLMALHNCHKHLLSKLSTGARLVSDSNRLSF